MPLNAKQLKQFYDNLGQRLAKERQKLANIDGIALLINTEAAKQDFVKNAVQKRFDDEAGPDGPWKALKPSTLKQRRKQRFGFGPILQRTGTLKATALRGKTTATTTTLTLQIKDGPAPKYSRGSLSRYAGVLNAARPFLVPLKGKERAALDKFTERAVAAYLTAVLNGD